MLIKILLVIAILIQTVATAYALKLVRATKYNSVWILFIVGFSLLSVERFVQLLMASGQYVPRWWFAYLGIVISICLSIGVMYAHKLIRYIDRLNRQRQLMQKRILTAVLRTEEKSRSQFSKELHDGLGPLLSSAKMSLTALSREERTPAQREIIDNTTYVIDEAIRSLREISNNLSPQVLNDFGLARGIQNFISRSAALHSVRIRFTTNLRAERFDTDIEVILYRVVCELINNSLKHSGCSEINLSLSSGGDTLTLDYSDNGCGFIIHNPMSLWIVGVFHIAVGWVGGQILTRFTFLLHNRFDFFTAVLDIELVDDIQERSKIIVLLIGAVHTAVHGCAPGIRGGRRGRFGRGVPGDAAGARGRCRIHGYRHARNGGRRGDRAGVGAATRSENHHAVDVRRRGLLHAYDDRRSQRFPVEGQ